MAWKAAFQSPRYGVAPRGRTRPARARGQNLLIDAGVAVRVVKAAALPQGAAVLEIGAGGGMLTAEISRSAARVVAVEIEYALAEKLRKQARRLGNVMVINADARRIDLEGLMGGEPYHVVSNLPYSVGTPLTVDLVQSDRRPVTLTVMLQLEVAQRLCADPGDMSLLSLLVQSFADAALMFEVGPEAFRPRPKVRSAVVRMVTNSVPRDDRLTRVAILLARHAFTGRRKKVQNSLAGSIRTSTEAVAALCKSAGIDPGLRPQAISVRGWQDLAEAALAGGFFDQAMGDELPG